MTINPKRPYFVRAMHEWLTDNNFTPYIMVSSETQGLTAPLQYAQNGVLVLCISYQATKDLFIDNQGISFHGRFGGVSQEVYVPMNALLAIYAKEDGEQGFYFDPTEYDDYTPPTDEPPKTGGHLKFV